MSISNPEHASKPSQHLLFMDGLRGLTALFVTIHHMWLQLWPQAQQALPGGLMLAVTGWLGYGHFGVTVLFASSGVAEATALPTRAVGWGGEPC